MIRNQDLVVGAFEGKEVIKPDWYKVILFAGIDSKITKHECLYEGKVAYEKLDNHVIIGQITVKGERKPGDQHKDIELTPIVNIINPPKPREILPSGKNIWRFMSSFKFEDLINSQTLHF